MQRNGYPVTRDALIARGKEVYAKMYGKTRAAGTIGRGWCDRFLGRYPILTTRNAQKIKRVRNEIALLAVTAFFWRCARAVIMYAVGADRFFNMDETGFVQNAKTKKVIAMKGSRNVWCRTVEASFHLTLVAAASASGFLIPSVFILPGKRVNRDVMNACTIPGAKITTAKAGFMTTDVMIKWIEHFAQSVPTPIKRPLALVLDGAGSHMDLEIDLAAERFGVVLVQLPPNASHLYQPLDVAVFKGVKSVLKDEIYNYMIRTGLTNICTKDALTLASNAWEKGFEKKSANIAAGFREAGIWPLSLDAMKDRLDKFHSNGVKEDLPQSAWLAVRETVRSEILVLSPKPQTTQRRRKTVDVKRRLLTNDDLEASDG